MHNQSSKPGRPVRAAVVGATGLAGQQFLVALSGHPWFELASIAASRRSAGRPYREAISLESGQLAWYADAPMPAAVAEMPVHAADELDLSDIDVVFTAVESAAARELEPIYAARCPVISTASAFRYEDDVPLLLPAINPEHAALVRHQAARRGWRGFIAPNPNCTTVGLAITLAPLHRAFGVTRVHMVSLQSVSGAGRSPGVSALDVVDNVIPFIPGEERKVQVETAKILGTLEGDAIVPAPFGVSCTCTRIGVLEGHTEVVFVELDRPAEDAAIRSAWAEFAADYARRGYPSCPDRLIAVMDDPFRPQVRLDRDAGDGMTTTVGRLRRDDTCDNGWRYVLCSHNTKMGAAKGCTLVAEQLIDQGIITIDT